MALNERRNDMFIPRRFLWLLVGALIGGTIASFCFHADWRESVSTWFKGLFCKARETVHARKVRRGLVRAKDGKFVRIETEV